MERKNYNYFDEAEADINLDEFEDINDFISRRRQAENLGFFPTNVAQNPAMVNYGIGTLPQFDMANLPMYEKDDEETEQYEIDKFGYRKKPSGIAKLLDFAPIVGEKSLGGAILRSILPEPKPEFTNIRNFYGDRFGLDSIGRVASGIMKGYNPVSGGFLNTITGGRFGQPTNYGLAGAMQRRIEKILGRKIAQTDASREKIKKLRDLQLSEIKDRYDSGESLGSIGASTFSGPGMAFEKQPGGSVNAGTPQERNYGGR